jgi:hypothetical protein
MNVRLIYKIVSLALSNKSLSRLSGTGRGQREEERERIAESKHPCEGKFHEGNDR